MQPQPRTGSFSRALHLCLGVLAKDELLVANSNTSAKNSTKAWFSAASLALLEKLAARESVTKVMLGVEDARFTGMVV